MSIGGSVLSILTEFLSNRSQQVTVDGCRSKLVSVVSGVPQGSVPIHTLNYYTEQSVLPGFYLEVCLNVTFIIVDPW